VNLTGSVQCQVMSSCKHNNEILSYMKDKEYLHRDIGISDFDHRPDFS
jgi:spore coat protein CotF